MAIVDDLMAQVASLSTQLAAANAQIASLKLMVPFNVREVSRTAFRKRLFEFIPKDKLFDLMQNDNTETEFKRVARVLGNQNANQAVRLDGNQVGKLLDDLVALSLLTTQQVAIIKRDATSQDAFV